MRTIVPLCLLLLLGAGCIAPASLPVEEGDVSGGVSVEADVQLPVDGYVERRTWKDFGEYFEGRFRGYHTGDDIEFDDVAAEVPVYAIEDGRVLYLDWATGYGGVMVVEHVLADGSTVRALYGHIDQDSATVQVGDAVAQGQLLASLGKGESKETDKERKHLHFGLYTGEFKINGYTLNEDGLADWINPQDFFATHGVDMLRPAFDGIADEASFAAWVSFPANTDVEYVPQLDAYNLFTLEGEGSARARSIMMIMPTRVDHAPGDVDLPFQPAWMNGEVHVTEQDGHFIYEPVFE